MSTHNGVQSEYYDRRDLATRDPWPVSNVATPAELAALDEWSKANGISDEPPF